MVFFHQFVARAQEVATTHQSKRDSNSNKKARSLKEVLAEMERKYNVRFSFDSDLLEDKYENVGKQPTGNVEQALRVLLAPHQLDFQRISKRYYSIFSKQQKEKADTGTSLHGISFPTGAGVEPFLENGSLKLPESAFLVSGSVTDAAGQPMTGVNILEKGTANGTVSDAEGKFRLQVTDEKAVLVISYIGFTTEEVPVNGRSEIQTQLLPDLQSLSEVVVIGYGTQKQKEVTMAVSSVTSKDIAGVMVTGLDQALQGRLAGVQVTQNSGEPGGNVSVRIRGLGSINGSNEPLYIVDGVPYGSLNAINPNDIERIDVLKDAASAAIYGSRGSNGVVLVTTKRGLAGKVQVTLDAYAGVQSASRKLDLLNGPQFAQLANENLVNGGKDPNPAWSNPSAVPNTDWQDEIFKSAPIQSYNVNYPKRCLRGQEGNPDRRREWKRYPGWFDDRGDFSTDHSVGCSPGRAVQHQSGWEHRSDRY
jgi:TonB-dependent SusC/RagA subfamily outer membrane receptor